MFSVYKRKKIHRDKEQMLVSWPVLTNNISIALLSYWTSCQLHYLNPCSYSQKVQLSDATSKHYVLYKPALNLLKAKQLLMFLHFSLFCRLDELSQINHKSQIV